MSDIKKEMIEVHRISDMEGLTRKAVFKAEGRMEEHPRQVGGDRTVTYGYGYTFIRYGGRILGWQRYEHLEKDLAAIGIKLTDTETKSLRVIAKARNDKKFAEVNKLISQFEKDWANNHEPLTHDKAVTLFREELSHKANDIKRRFKKHLGKAASDELYEHLNNSREIAGLYKMTYNSGAGTITKDLAEALFDGNRAKACSVIQHESNKVQKRFLKGIAKERYLASSFIGYYFDPAHPTPKEVEDVLDLEKTKGKAIAKYEKGYRNPIFNAKKEYKDALLEGKVSVTPFYDALKTANNAQKGIVAESEALEAAPVSSYKSTNEPDSVHAKKDHIQPSIEPPQPEGGLLSTIGEMGQRMHDSDVDAAKAQGLLPELMGTLLDSMFSPANTEASELSPLRNSQQQTMNQPRDQQDDYSIVSVSELRKTASDALSAMDTRELDIRGFMNEKSGRPLTEDEIASRAVYSNLTRGEQQTVRLEAEMAKERAKLTGDYRYWADTTRLHGFDRFHKRLMPDFMKSDRQLEFDQLRKEIGQRDLDLTKRETANRPEMEKILERIRTPEFQEKAAETVKEILAKDEERVKEVRELSREWDTFAGQRFCINRLKDKLPERIGDMGVKVKGDPKDIDNLLAQSDRIAAQTKPAMEMTRQYERGMEWS
jgi:hypothetical protein